MPPRMSAVALTWSARCALAPGIFNDEADAVTENGSPDNSFGEKGVRKLSTISSLGQLVKESNGFLAVGEQTERPHIQLTGFAESGNLDTGFGDWFEDYPHPNDFFEPLLAAIAIGRPSRYSHNRSRLSKLSRRPDLPSGTRVSRGLPAVIVPSGSSEPIFFDATIQRSPAQSKRIGRMTHITIRASQCLANQNCLDRLQAHVVHALCHRTSLCVQPKI